MNDDYLKLTAYFAERQRISDGFAAEAMLDLYGRNQVETSIMLRGIASFGPRHHLRSDESLSLSEDPPVVVAAVDERVRIAGLVDDVVAMTPRGLVTIERARLPGADVAGFAMPTEPSDAAKLTIYLGRRQRVSGVPAYLAICELLERERFAGASVFLGVDGTARGVRHRAHFFSRNVDVPMMIIAVGARERVAHVVPELGRMPRRPLLTVERVRVCKRDGELLARPDTLPPVDDNGLAFWQKLMVYTSEATRHDGLPIHRALVRRLRESDTAMGATVLRGIWGFHGNQKPHGDKLFQLSRQVPVTTIVIDTPERIASSFDIVDELTDRHGLVTSEMVPALVSIDGHERRGGTTLARFRY